MEIVWKHRRANVHVK